LKIRLENCTILQEKKKISAKNSMYHEKHIVVIIPARGGSKRLKRKNIYPVHGKPMVGWAIDATKNSSLIDRTYVTSEDPEILTVSETFGASSIVRPPALAEDHVFKMVPIRHAVEWIEAQGDNQNPDIVVILQANSPEVETRHLENAIKKLVDDGKQEIFSVDKNLNQNAAFRVMTRDCVFQRELSTNCGVYITDEYDVHTKEDVDIVEQRMKEKGLV